MQLYFVSEDLSNIDVDGLLNLQVIIRVKIYH